MLRISLMASLAAVLMMAVQFPLLPGLPFLKYDPSDIPVFIGAFALGPLEGVAIALVKDLMFLVGKPGPWEFVGVPMNFAAVATYVWVASTFYWRKKTKKRAIVSLILGSLASVAVMIPLNLLVLPMFVRFFGLPSLSGIVVPITLFNALKCGINSVLVFFSYKKVAHWIKVQEDWVWEPLRRRTERG